MTDVRRQVTELPYATAIEDDDILYLRSNPFDYQVKYSVLKGQIAIDSDALRRVNVLSELTSVAPLARSNLGIKSSALHDAGKLQGQVVLIEDNNGAPALPALDGSRLYNIAQAGAVNTNTAGDGLGITPALQLFVQADNQTLTVTNDKVGVLPSGINSAQIASGAIEGKHIARTAVDGTSIQIVGGQLKAPGVLSCTSGIVGSNPTSTGYNLVSSLYTLILPPQGKTMANFAGGMTAVAVFGTADTDVGNDLNKSDYEVLSNGIKVWHLYSTSRSQIDGQVLNDGDTLAAISNKTSYIFFWS